MTGYWPFPSRLSIECALIGADWRGASTRLMWVAPHRPPESDT